MKDKIVISWQAWTIGVFGLWFMTAAFLNFDSTVNSWNNLLVGSIVTIIGYTIVKQKEWQAWVCMAIGMWVAISAFIPSLLTGQGYLWNDIISGLVMTIGGFGALSKPKEVSRA